MKKEAGPKLKKMTIEFHHDAKGMPTGHTIHHEHMMTPNKSSAFMEGEKPASFPFGAGAENAVMAHVKQHLGGGMSNSMEAPKPQGSAQEEEEEEMPT